MEAQRANSVSYKHTAILTILSFELTVFEMQCIYEIEGSVILVQSYKHHLYSRQSSSMPGVGCCKAIWYGSYMDIDVYLTLFLHKLTYKERDFVSDRRPGSAMLLEA